MAEMALLRPLMAGDDTGDQLAEIVDLMGVPSSQEMEAMGIEDDVLAAAIGVVGGRGAGELSPAMKITKLVGTDYKGLGDLVSQLLRYDPQQRMTGQDFLADKFFFHVRKRKEMETRNRIL